MLSGTRPRTPFRLLYALVGTGCLLVVAALSIPALDGGHSRQYRNEALAVSKLRTVVALEKQFAASHIDKGFTCELPLLNPGDKDQLIEYDPMRFLRTGTQAGYKFALDDCRTDPNGVTIHYDVMAVPVERGKTGFHAFCTDDSGLLWYDPEWVGEDLPCSASSTSRVTVDIFGEKSQ